MLQREEQVGKFVGGKVEQNKQISRGKIAELVKSYYLWIDWLYEIRPITAVLNICCLSRCI